MERDLLLSKGFIEDVLHSTKVLFEENVTPAWYCFLDHSYSATLRDANKMMYVSSSLVRVFFARCRNVRKDKTCFTEFKYIRCTGHTVCPYFLLAVFSLLTRIVMD